MDVINSWGFLFDVCFKCKDFVCYVVMGGVVR